MEWIFARNCEGTEQLRYGFGGEMMMQNLVLGMLAHVDAGKTTLSEAILYQTKTIQKFGRVDKGDTFLDTDAMERQRGITIFSKQAQLEIGGRPVTLLDTPGHIDFSAEMERTLQVLDYAILIISGADGVQSHTATLWKLLARYQVPVFLFVNKMDQPGTDRGRLMEELHHKLSGYVTDFSYPDYEEIALGDEAVMEHYLETGEISDGEIAGMVAKRQLFPCFFGSALKNQGVKAFLEALSRYVTEKTYPEDFGARAFKISRDEQGNRLTWLKVTGGTLTGRMQITETEKVNQIRVYSGEKYKPVQAVAAGGVCAVTGLEESRPGDSFGVDTPSLVPMLAPVLTYQLQLPEGMDAMQMLPKLRQLEEEDPQLHILWSDLTKEIQIQVMGAVQIEILQTMIRERFGVDVTFGTGSIIYKETIASVVEGVGHFEPLRHYAEVHLLLEPGEPGSGMEYVLDCSEDVLDRNWQRLILTHLYERTHRGVLTGAPLTDVRISVVAGRAHPKHTEGGDFRQATYRAVRQGLMQAESILLEPVYSFEMELPRSAVGRAMMDLERMNGAFTLEETGTTEESRITGTVPVASFGTYQTEFVAYTRGQGRLSLQMAGYEPCHNTEEVVAASGYEAERDTINTADSVFCAHGAGVVVPWEEVYDHMHVESVLERRRQTGSSDISVTSMGQSRTVSDVALGTEEVDDIISRTFYANSRSQEEVRKSLHQKRLAERQTATYKGKERSINGAKTYLLVDGYNIIFAWKELAELAKDNIDGARGRLQDILCNYQAMKGCEVIVIFDAYRLQGHPTEQYDYHNIHVIFTKEAETADQYIEKFAHEKGHEYHIRVATSDGLEQIIIRGAGCYLVSAREFEAEVKACEQQLREDYLGRTY